MTAAELTLKDRAKDDNQLNATEILALEEATQFFYVDGPTDNPFGQPDSFDNHRDFRTALNSAKKKLARQAKSLAEIDATTKTKTKKSAIFTARIQRGGEKR